MSGEYCWVGSCYAHEAIEQMAAEFGGRAEGSEEIANILRALVGPVHDICWIEACDSSEGCQVVSIIRCMPALKEAVNRLDEIAKKYQRAFEQMIREKKE